MVVGIDLGTTYSVCAYLDKKGEPRILENAQKSAFTPSVVWIEDSGLVHVGQLAKEHAVTDAKNVVLAVKNYMGTKKVFNEFSSGEKHTPETISGFILKKVMRDASKKLGEDIKDAIITVPAYFTDAQREATAQAAKLAGIHMVASINEPTAAALCFAKEKDIEKANVMVYDLGGGTFDVTIVTIDGQRIEVRACEGISHAGGRFFDEEIVKYVCEYIEGSHGIDLCEESYKEVLQELYIKAEQCKIELGECGQSDIEVEAGDIRETVTITRDFFESRVHIFYKRSESKMKKALQSAGMNIREIDHLLLVGGSSKIPYIQEKLREFYGRKLSCQVDPDVAVAKGAAIYGSLMETPQLQFSDVCSHSIGVVTVDPVQKKKVNSILIQKNTKLPTQISTKLRTVGSDNRSITISMTEGEFEALEDVAVLCDLKLELPQEVPAGCEVWMQLQLDQCQKAHIFLEVPSIQVHREFQFDRLHNLNEDEFLQLSDMVSDKIVAEDHDIPQKENQNLLDKLTKKRRDTRKKYVYEESVNIEEAFENIYGMQEIRRELGNLHRLLQLEEERKEVDIESSILRSTHFTIAGGKAVGKTMLAETIHKILYAYGIRSGETAHFVEGRDLASAFEQLMKTEDQTIIIENIEKCADKDGMYDRDNILWPLKKLLSRKKHTLSVLITGTTEGIHALLAQEQELQADLYKNFEIPPYTVEELMQICISMAEGRKLLIDERARGYIRKVLRRNYKKSGFTNAAYLGNMLEAASFHMADRISAKGYDEEIEIVTLVYEDFLSDDDGETEIRDAVKQLDRLIGLQSVKQVVMRKIDEANFMMEQEETGLDGGSRSVSRHLVFYGSPGTGKTTVARLMGSIYHSLGLLPENKLVECTAGDLVAGFVGQTAQKTRAKINEALGGVLFIDEAYMLSDDKGQYNAEAVAEILTQMETHKDELMVIMAGYKEEMEHFFRNTNEGLISRFPPQNRIVFEDYSPRELKEIFCSYVDSSGYVLETGCEELLEPMLEEKSKEDGFNNARGVRNTFEHVMEVLRSRVSAMEYTTREDYRLIRKIDIEHMFDKKTEEAKGKDYLLAELDSMIGLKAVKKEMERIVKSIEANLFFANHGGRSEEVRVSNMLFLGNPGTGKTTVARIFCEILEELGVLKKKGHFVEADREKLVSKFVGQTAGKTRKVVEQAYGGVLFIDEAYSLIKDHNDSYGREAVDTLLKLMEDHRDELIVIAAGYTEEMKEFIDSNSGRASRFSTTLTFEDYTIDELYEILKSSAGKNNCTIRQECEQPVKAYFLEQSRQKNFGNARAVRNLYEKLYDAMKIRIFELVKNSRDQQEIPQFEITLEDFLEVTSQEQ